MTVRDVRFRVSPLVHAFDADSVTENKNVPEVDADHTEISVIVSDVPPLVNDGVPDIVTTPADAAPKVKLERVDEPALTLVVPAVPGSAVWIWHQMVV